MGFVLDWTTCAGNQDPVGWMKTRGGLYRTKAEVDKGTITITSGITQKPGLPDVPVINV